VTAGQQTIQITGATSGIGRAAALELCRRGADLILVVRNREKGDAVVAELKSARPDAKIDLIVADLSVLSDMRRAAGEVKARHRRLDVLINNAGIVSMQRRTTADGHEATFATNHLGYFVVTNLLLDLLKASAPSRIVNVASDAHRRGKIELDDLEHERRYFGMRVYEDSKLMNVLFTVELARRLEGSGVTANCLHPGVVATGYGTTEGNVLFKWMVKIAHPFMRSPEKGAETTVFLATSPEVARQSGGYYQDCKATRTSRRAQDLDMAKRLWDATAKLTGVG
jgi:NAD(P)-dependent dehydrogenase (short-subunit alcohol dehydrogenase family)